jgi:hypothetical protein
MANEEMEEVELLCGQLQQLAGSSHLSGARVELQLVERQGVGPWAVRLGAAEHAPDPCDQLAWGERLRDVVVGAELETDDPVGLLPASRQHDHG